jgi:hypothetical protein
MNSEALKEMVKKVMIEDLDISDLAMDPESDVIMHNGKPYTYRPTGEVNIVLTKPKANGTQRLSVKIFHNDDEFLLVGSVDTALQVVSMNIYKKQGSRILDIE